MTAGCANLYALQARQKAKPTTGNAATRRLTLTDQPQQIAVPVPPVSMAAPMTQTTAKEDWDIPAPDPEPTPTAPQTSQSWGQSFAMAASEPSSKPIQLSAPPAPHLTTPDRFVPALSKPLAAPPPPPPSEPIPEEHKVFDAMGQSRSHVRTFDLGQIDMDAHLDRIEQSLSMSQAATKDLPAPPPPEDAHPLDELDLLSEVASISDDLLSDIDMPDSPEEVSGMIASRDEPAPAADSNGPNNASMRMDQTPPDQTQSGGTAVLIDNQTKRATANPSHAGSKGGQSILVGNGPSEKKDDEVDNEDDDDLFSLDFSGAPLQPLPLPQIGMMILADIHNLAFDTAAMTEGRNGWQAFDDLPRAVTLPALKKAVGLRTAIISAQEFADHNTWPTVIVGNPKAREAILVSARDETGLQVVNPDGATHSASPGAVLAALGDPQTITIATIADSPVTAALSNLTGG